MINLQGKTALITGSSRGIGKAIAHKLGKLGANVVLNGTGASVEETAKELCEEGINAISVVADLRTSEAVEMMFSKATEAFGRIDILVNNAGITRDNLMIRMSEQDWNDVLDTNLKGAFLCTKVAAKLMMKQRSGRIINISSVVGVMGNAGQVNYCAAKAGMIGMTKATARELASRNVTCNAIAPGFIETQMTDTLPEKIKENYMASIPAGRFGTPEDVAHAVAFLASDAATYITGQVIHIDGGLVM